MIATLYQDLGATSVTDYGARVAQIYKGRLWLPTPGMLERIKEKFDEFDRMDPLQQIDILQ